MLGGEGCLVDVVCQVEGEEESHYINTLHYLLDTSDILLDYFEIVESIYISLWLNQTLFALELFQFNHT